MIKIIQNSHIIRAYARLFSNPHWYRIIVKAHWAEILSIFLFSHLIIGIVASSTLYLRTVPSLTEDLRMIVNIGRKYISEELIFSWDVKQETLSIEPYPAAQTTTPLINIPSSELASLKTFRIVDRNVPKYILSINPTVFRDQITEAYPSDLEENDFSETNVSETNMQDIHQSLLLITANDLVISQHGSERSSMPLSYIPQFSESFTVNAAFTFSYLSQSIDKIESILHQYWYVAVLASVPIMMFFTIGNLLIDTVFIILLVMINRYRLSIKETIKLSLLFGVVATTVHQVAQLLYPALHFPIYNITFWILAGYILLIHKRIWT